MYNDAYEQAVIELFSSGLATEEQWLEMATAIKLMSDDFVLRDVVVEIDAAVRTDNTCCTQRLSIDRIRQVCLH